MEIPLSTARHIDMLAQSGVQAALRLRVMKGALGIIRDIWMILLAGVTLLN